VSDKTYSEDDFDLLLKLPLAKATWDESKHPRGHEGNPGEFAPKGEGGAAPAAEDKESPVELPAPEREAPKAKADRRGPRAEGIQLNDHDRAVIDISREQGTWKLRGLRDDVNRKVTDGIADTLKLREKDPVNSDEKETDSLDDLYESNDQTRADIKEQIADTLDHETGIGRYQTKNIIKQWANSSNDDEIDSLMIQKGVSEEFGIELSDWQKEKLNAYSDAEKAGNPAVKQKKLDEYMDQINNYGDTLKADIADHQKVHPDTSVAQAATAAVYGDSRSAKLWPHFDAEPYFQHKELEQYLRSKVRDGEFETVDWRKTLGQYVDQYQYMEPERQFGDDQIKTTVRAMYDKTQDHFKQMGFSPDDEVQLFRGTRAEVRGDAVGAPAVVHGNAAESWSLSPSTASYFGPTTLMAKVKVKDILSTCATGFGCVNEAEVVVLGGTDYTALIVRAEEKEKLVNKADQPNSPIVFTFDNDADDDWIRSPQVTKGHASDKELFAEMKEKSAPDQE
jgi:hypothetical protein